MSISELPQDIMVKAFINRAKNDFESTDNNLYVAFSWEQSKEGYAYWSYWHKKKHYKLNFINKLLNILKL